MRSLIFFILMLFFISSANAHTHKHKHKVHHEPVNQHVLKVNSKIVLVFDEQSGSSVFDKNSDKVVPIASITKLMTAMVTLDANLPMDEVISIGTDDLISRIKSRLKIGRQFTRSELLQLALMSSENRAALALARSYPAGYDAFILAMNKKAKELEMNNTEFHEPTGLDHNNVSTAQDLVKMVIAASSYSTIHQYTTTTGTEIENIGHKKPLKYHNTNPLVSSTEWNIGISKTGYIRDAGRCLVMQTVINDNPVVIVILDSRTKKGRVNDAKNIKKWVEKNPNVIPVSSPSPPHSKQETTIPASGVMPVIPASGVPQAVTLAG